MNIISSAEGFDIYYLHVDVEMDDPRFFQIQGGRESMCKWKSPSSDCRKIFSNNWPGNCPNQLESLSLQFNQLFIAIDISNWEVVLVESRYFSP